MKKIWPLLLLLLLLIFLCAWQKTDKIILTKQVEKKPTTIISIPLEEHSIEYLIKQDSNSYTLNGNFKNILQQTELITLFKTSNSKLIPNNTSTNKTLLEKGSISLTKKLIPLFVKSYQQGEIHYVNDVLVVEGKVDSYKVKHHMQKLLATSAIATQDNTKVILPIPINFLLVHSKKKNILSGQLINRTQEETLQKVFTAFNVPILESNITENSKLIDTGIINLVKNILPTFIQDYTYGEISYQDNLLTIKGKVKSTETLKKMESLLSNTKIPFSNQSILDKEYIYKLAELKKAEEIQLAEENRQLEQEKLRLEQEAAEQARIEEEKIQKAKQEAAEKIRLEEEQKRDQQEKERNAKEKELLLAREAAEKKILEEQAAKANIVKLLQIENIEFNTAKATLTDKGHATVDKLASILKKYPHVKIEIAGHTDTDGSETFNKTLSQSRVDTVKKELVLQGIDAQHLTAKGYGESKPLVPNTTDENKQKNRRVEINIIGE